MAVRGSLGDLLHRGSMVPCDGVLEGGAVRRLVKDDLAPRFPWKVSCRALLYWRVELYIGNTVGIHIPALAEANLVLFGGSQHLPFIMGDSQF